MSPSQVDAVIFGQVSLGFDSHFYLVKKLWIHVGFPT